jgi:hypothetical protein
MAFQRLTVFHIKDWLMRVGGSCAFCTSQKKKKKRAFSVARWKIAVGVE